MKARTKSRIALILAGLILAVAVCVSVYLWQMVDRATNFDANPSSDVKIVSQDQIDWDYWKSVNPDIVGWIMVDGTAIDYPIVQTHANDPEFYLHHDIYMQQNIYGVPYLDSDCESKGFESENALVFGHHMDDGSVFSDFAKYNDVAYAREHQDITVFTPETTYHLKTRYIDVVSGNAHVKRTDFLDKTDFSIWYKESRDQADVVLDTTTQPTKVMTFVTCSYNQSQDERTMVVGSE